MEISLWGALILGYWLTLPIVLYSFYAYIMRKPDKPRHGYNGCHEPNNNSFIP